MNRSTILSFIIFVCLLCNSCVQDMVEDNSLTNTFEVFWEIMDERYVYFDEKGIDWDSIYTEYRPQISDAITEDSAVTLFAEILSTLDDGHLSVFTTKTYFDSRYIKSWFREDKFFEYYPFSNIKVCQPVFTLAQAEDSILYISVDRNTQQASVSITELEISLTNYNYNNGIIIDLRKGAGGALSTLKLPALFCPEGKHLAFYLRKKTGPGHHDFSDYEARYIYGKEKIPAEIPKVVLCNETTFSGGSFLATTFSTVENCTLIGERTGGGGTGPRSLFLPNGWQLNYTASNKNYSINKESLEAGVPVDIEVIVTVDFWKETHASTGEDRQFEAALHFLDTIK